LGVGVVTGAGTQTRTAGTVSATVPVDASDPVFAGHYPGFPILPGLYLVEYVHDAVCAARATPTPRPVALERIRFLNPVYPGDVVLIEADLDDLGDGMRCAATVSVGSTQVAELRLRYPGGAG
jgi:3-hydroxyacyl-[acyl-carrier-protein] dehydratase